MSKSEMSKIDTIFVGPLMLFFNQYFNFYFDEYIMLWLAFVSRATFSLSSGPLPRLILVPFCLPLQTYILIDFCYFSYSTCVQLADFLNIYVLTIVKRPPQKPSTSANSVSAMSNSSSQNGRDSNTSTTSSITTRHRSGNHVRR